MATWLKLDVAAQRCGRSESELLAAKAAGSLSLTKQTGQLGVMDDELARWLAAPLVPATTTELTVETLAGRVTALEQAVHELLHLVTDAPAAPAPVEPPAETEPKKKSKKNWTD